MIAGLQYVPAYLDAAQHDALLATVSALDWQLIVTEYQPGDGIRPRATRGTRGSTPFRPAPATIGRDSGCRDRGGCR